MTVDVDDLDRTFGPDEGADTEVPDLGSVRTLPERGDDPSLDPPARVGRFELQTRLGHGAMGTVYEAHDPHLDRKVAVKLLRGESWSGRGQAAARRRLIREAQAMAKLSHPHVVAVHEVGVVDRDLVFIAMELVQGRTLAQWIEQAPRPGPARTRAALGLLLQAGRGLLAAHAVGLVHRDFKPANVLVGDDGRVRVADFGVARPGALDGALDGTADERPTGSDSTGPDAVSTHPIATDGTAAPTESLEDDAIVRLTGTGELVGTPAYMAPEQFAGRSDERSDQFAFCVTLHEALYGRRPFEAGSASALYLAIVAGQVPPEPDGAGVPRPVRRALLRGLAVEPGQRFESMASLLEVLAAAIRPSTRRWVSVIAGAAVVAGVAVAGRWAQPPSAPPCPLPRERLDGVWDAARRSAVHDALAGTPAPYAGQTARAVTEQLDAYTEQWLLAHRQACEATRVTAEQSEALLDLRVACLQRRLDDVAALTGALEQPDAVLKAGSAVSQLTPLSVCADVEHLQRAVPEPDDPERREQVHEVQRELAAARAAFNLAQYDVARAGFEHALARARELAHPPLLAEATLRTGIAVANAGEDDAAQALLREAIDAAAHARDDETEATAWAQLVHLVGYKLGQPERALDWTPAVWAAVVRAGEPVHLRRMAHLLVGSVRRRAGDLEGAQRDVEAALALGREGHDDHPARQAQALLNYSSVLYAQGRYADAEQALLQASEIFARQYGADHPTRAEVENNLGGVAYSLGHYEDALAHMRTAIEIRERVYGPSHSSLVDPLTNQGSALERLGRYEDSVAAHQRALSVAEATLGPDHEAVGGILNNLGNAQEGLGRFADAEVSMRRALDNRRRTLPDDHPSITRTMTALGRLVERRGRPQEAIELLEQAVARYESKLGPEHPDLATALAFLGRIYTEQGRPDDGVATLGRALSIRERTEADPRDVAELRYLLADALWQQGPERSRARSLAEQAAQDLAALAPSEAGPLRPEIDAWLRDHPAPPEHRG